MTIKHKAGHRLATPVSFVIYRFKEEKIEPERICRVQQKADLYFEVGYYLRSDQSRDLIVQSHKQHKEDLALDLHRNQSW